MGAGGGLPLGNPLGVQTPEQRLAASLALMGKSLAPNPFGARAPGGQEVAARPGQMPDAPAIPQVPGATTPLPPSAQGTPVMAGAQGGGQPGGGGIPISPSGAANSFSYPSKRAAKTASTYDTIQSFVGLAKQQQETKQKKEANESYYLLKELDNARTRYEANPNDTGARDYYNELLADKRTQKVLKDIQGYTPKPIEGPPPAVQGAVKFAQEQQQQQKAQQAQQGQQKAPQQNPLQKLLAAAKGVGSNLTGRSNLPQANPNLRVPAPPSMPPQQQQAIDKAVTGAISSMPKEMQPLYQGMYDIAKMTPGGLPQAAMGVLKGAAEMQQNQVAFGQQVALKQAEISSKEQLQNMKDQFGLQVEQMKDMAKASHDDAMLKRLNTMEAGMNARFAEAMSTKVEVANINAHKLTSAQIEANGKLQAGAELTMTTVDSLIDNIQYIKDHPVKVAATGIPIVGRMVGDDKSASVAADFARLRGQAGIITTLYGASGLGMGGGQSRYANLLKMSGASALSNPDETLKLLKGMKTDLQTIQAISAKSVAAGQIEDSDVHQDWDSQIEQALHKKGN
jgi:hypothetical protein